MNLKAIQIPKEWMVNGALLAAIVVLLVLIGAETFSPLPKEETAAPAATPERAPLPPAPTGETSYGPGPNEISTATLTTRSDIFPNLRRHNVFREIVTPIPPTPKPPPTPTPTPDLSAAVSEWKYLYPIPRKNVFVFSIKGGKQIEIEGGKPYTVEAGRQKFDVTVEKSGRYEAIVRYGDQAVRKSLLE